MMPVRLKKFRKLGSAETCSVYDVAPEEALQLSVGVVETPVAPLVGELRIGVASTVVKVHVAIGLGQALVPPALVALTRQ